VTRVPKVIQGGNYQVTGYKTRKWYRPPTQQEIDAFEGVHVAGRYRRCVQIGWRCPCCNRTAQELIRWSFINGHTNRLKYGDEYGMGWTLALIEHHCHSGDRDGWLPRFPVTLICGDCNSADGAAKRKLRLPEWWSFSPIEIKQFVTCVPHSGKTVIDYEKANKIWHEISLREIRASVSRHQMRQFFQGR